MNTALFTDPVVLISSGVILVGFVALLWAIGKWKQMGSASSSSGEVDHLIAATESAPELPDIDFRPPELPIRSSVSSAPAVSKDVADRLESMSQRLAEMQNVLMKQSAAPVGAGAASGVGQGFTPETIDKLLKIIGNVIQQVDILQKNLNTK